MPATPEGIYISSLDITPEVSPGGTIAATAVVHAEIGAAPVALDPDFCIPLFEGDEGGINDGIKTVWEFKVAGQVRESRRICLPEDQLGFNGLEQQFSELAPTNPGTYEVELVVRSRSSGAILANRTATFSVTENPTTGECPSGFIRNPDTGQCEPSDSGGDGGGGGGETDPGQALLELIQNLDTILLLVVIAIALKLVSDLIGD